MTDHPSPAAPGPARAVATGLRILTLDGPDAADFLEGQSMTPLKRLADQHMRLSAFADARGRVIAIAPAWRSGPAWRLALPAGEADWFAQRLARYKLRARVDIDVQRDTVVAGVTGPLPAGLEPGTVDMEDAIEMAALDAGRRLVVAAADAPGLPFSALSAEAPEEDDWKRTRLLAGEPRIREATRAAYLPQMLGLDELGAVGFSKGCYPGQEVIARTRNLGRVKRRLVLLRCPKPAAEGTGEIDGVKLDILDCVPDAGEFLVQAVAPHPLPDALSGRVAPVQIPATGTS